MITIQSLVMSEWFFDSRLWLPENFSWKDLEGNDSNEYFGRPRDLFHSVYLAIVLYFLRLFVERYLWEPIGRYYGLTHRKYAKVENNRNLEFEYKRNKRPNNDEIKNFSKANDMDEHYLQRWFRRRRNQDKSDILTKFTECGWRFTFYSSVFTIGCWVLHDQEFVWDTRLMWSKVPFNNITPSMFWYIMIELAYYLSSVITYFFDVKRKDFWQMLIHHLSTISLISLAWIQNFIPVSLYILCIHDFVDYIMEAAKMFKYVKKDLYCHILFIIFTVSWFLSRLVLYPVKIIYSSIYECKYTHAGARICQVFLIVLQVLHIMWFIMILRIAFQALSNTGIHKDSRSDSEMSLSDTDSKNNNNHKSNNKKDI